MTLRIGRGHASRPEVYAVRAGIAHPHFLVYYALRDIVSRYRYKFSLIMVALESVGRAAMEGRRKWSPRYGSRPRWDSSLAIDPCLDVFQNTSGGGYGSGS